ncbi:SCO2525 family SAM-dependent methyltransferase [Catellatospora sp. NPDC049609]|uniref:SCO2525 family SAM-dependent methyltransferase n=1 Tax=Catellatospora sp. NPDC049609 TaxID=3155505 RepID=UPI003423CE8C
MGSSAAAAARRAIRFARFDLGRVTLTRRAIRVAGFDVRRLSRTRRNSDFPWDDFDSEWYRAHNYLRLRDDDAEIMRRVATFLSGHAASLPAAPRGLDIGSGANLYPAMAMLPFCADIDLWDFSASNVRWLQAQRDYYDTHWDVFWNAYRKFAAYRDVTNPRESLGRKSHVALRSIFDLPRANWDMGTMFFVAESLTQDPKEFWGAVRRFGRALRPGAPFAAAFMAHSVGYTVGGTFFPAVAVGPAEVEDCLSLVAEQLTIDMVETETPLRRGYGGMILATGVARALS